MFLVVIAGGYIADRFGKKLFLLAGGLLLVTGLIGSMLSNNYMILLIFTIIVGIGFGAYEIGINALCADLNSSGKGKAMNYLHFFYGLGAIFAPLLATFCIKIINNWRFAFGITAILPIFVSILIINHKFIHKVPESGIIKEQIPFKNIFMWMAGISIFIYVGIEVSVYGWLPSFWAKLFPNDFIPASLTAVVFWICLTCGRLFSGKIVDKAGFSRYLTIASVFTLFIGLLWFLFPFRYSTLILTAFIGFTLSGIYPTIMASATSYFPQITGIISAFITIFASLGGLCVPSAIGYFADSKGIKILPFVIIIMAVLLVITIFVAWHILIKGHDKKFQ